MVNSISIALTGLDAASKKLNASASNVANMQTVGYTPVTTTQTTITDSNGNGLGVQASYAPKNPAFVPTYDPDSPFADENGIIAAPNVDLAEEGVNQILASTSYKANVQVIKAQEELDKELLSIFDKKV